MEERIKEFMEKEIFAIENWLKNNKKKEHTQKFKNRDMYKTELNNILKLSNYCVMQTPNLVHRIKNLKFMYGIKGNGFTTMLKRYERKKNACFHMLQGRS